MAEDKHIVFSYGRMNPPTAGHSKVVDKVKSHADKIGANHAVIVSHSQKPKTDPLHHEHKKEYLRHIHPDVNFEHSTKDHPHFLAQLKKFHQEGHTHATMVVGSDRVKQFKALAHKYNGKEYNYKKIHILSAGQRDPDAEGVAGISGTKMRNHASGNDFKSFKAGLHPNHSDEHAKKLFKATRQGMNLQKEETGMKDFATFLAEEEMKPHKMYKGDKVVVAKNKADHDKLNKQGYTHDNPKTKKIEEASADEVLKKRYASYSPDDNPQATRKLKSSEHDQPKGARVYKMHPGAKLTDRGYSKKGKMAALKKQHARRPKQYGITEDMEGMSQKSGDKRATDKGAGMTAQGVAKYNRRTGGNLKTAVTTPPSKLKKGSKAAGRRKSFCARSRGWTGERGKAARRRWNC